MVNILHPSPYYFSFFLSFNFLLLASFTFVFGKSSLGLSSSFRFLAVNDDDDDGEAESSCTITTFLKLECAEEGSSSHDILAGIDGMLIIFSPFPIRLRGTT